MEKEIELEQEAIVVYSGGGAVDSVNGYTGDVVLTTSDLENTSDYQTGTEVESAINTAIAGKQDTLTAGNNITISNNTISATDTTYTAGTGLTLDGTQFSVDTSTIATQQDVSDEATARENADNNLQGQIDAISASSDVTDIVGTYAALQAYDTTHLKDNDIIKVLQDESQNDETTYYRWSTSTQTFTLIGEEGPYYTKSQTDTLLQAKQDNLTAGANITIASDNTISATDTTYTAGTNVSISSGNVISATDTTYSDFTGTDGTAAGTAGLVPAPATTDAGKFLSASGLWEEVAGGGITELTSADYNYPAANPDGVAMWKLTTGFYSVATGTKIYVTASNNSTSSYSGLFLLHSNGYQCSYLMIKGANDSMRYWDVNIGAGTVREQFYIAQTVDNLTSSSEYSPLSANQGKVLKNLVDSLAIRASETPTTSTVGSVGTLYEDTTNGKLYICTDTTGGTYTWEEVGAGGSGPTVVQTTGNSTTDVMSQNATTSMVFADPSTKQKVQIGNGSNAVGDYALAIGRSAQVNNANGSVALGYNANVGSSHYWSVALGANSSTTSNGEVSFGGSGVSGLGYNNSNYRLLTNIYDGQSAHDAATKGQLDSIAIQNAGAPTTATVGTVGQLLEDTTNGKLYICTDTTGGTYTWEEVGAGGGGGGITELTTADYDYPTDNPDGIALWNLPIGWYAVPYSSNPLKVYLAFRSSETVYAGLFSISQMQGKVFIGKWISDLGNFRAAFRRTNVDGSALDTSWDKYYLLGNTSIVNNLTTNSSSKVLSAAQGKVINDKITPSSGASAPTTSTVGELGKIYIDSSTDNAYMCTKVDGSTYTWKQITA